MKKLKMLLLVVMVTFGSVLSASTNSIEKAEPVSISETVKKLLKNPNFQLDKDVNAMVEVFINKDNEMVVMSVETDNQIVESFIKNRLNYQKLSSKVIGDSKKFRIPVKIIQSK